MTDAKCAAANVWALRVTRLSRTVKSVSTVLTAVGALASGTAAADSDSLGEITVTARRVSENLQRVPVSVSALSPDDLDALSAGNLSDISEVTPNINFQQLVLGGSAASLIYIRGIGQSDTLITADPGVGLYLDGTYLGRMQGIDLDILDLSRVEVLRGPQGTLFGKNTIGGAINIVSAAPDATASGVDGRIDLIGGNFNRRDVVANVNLPVVKDTFAVRIAGSSRNDDGYGQRADGERTADQSKISGRISALYTPKGNWQFEGDVDYTDTNQHNGAYRLVYIGSPPLVGLYNLVAPVPYDSRWISNDPFLSYATGPNTDRAKLWGASLTTTYHGGAVDVKSITSYRSNDTTNNVSVDGSPLGLFYEFDTIHQHQVSEEIQLSGAAAGSALKWVAGIYYFQERAAESPSYTVYPALTPLIGDLSFNNYVHTDNKDYAVYGQGTYALTPELHLTIGLRSTYEEKQASVFQAAYSGATEIPFTEKHATFNSVSPRIGIDYQWTPELMTYVSAAQGYKSGGFNGRGSSAADFNQFSPEKNWTYEVGIRSDWFDRRLRINGSVYYTDYRDIQVTENYATEGGTPLSIIANAASAKIKGGELELTGRPVRRLLISASVGITEAEYTSAIAPPGGFPPVSSATKFVNTPRTTYSASAEYSVPAGAIAITPRVDYSYRSTIYHDISNSPYTTQDGYGLLNARLTIGPDSGPWSVALFGTNLTDKRYILGGTDVSASLGFAVALQGPPREWGADFRYKF